MAGPWWLSVGEEERDRRWKLLDRRCGGLDHPGGVHRQRMAVLADLDDVLEDAGAVHGAEALQCRAPAGRRAGHHRRQQPVEELLRPLVQAAGGGVRAPALVLEAGM